MKLQKLFKKRFTGQVSSKLLILGVLSFSLGNLASGNQGVRNLSVTSSNSQTQTGTSSSSSCQFDIDEALKNGCRDGKKLACDSQIDVRAAAEELNEEIKNRIFSSAKIGRLGNETTLVFDSITLRDLRNTWVSGLSAVDYFDQDVEDRLEDRWDDQFDGAGTFLKKGCYYHFPSSTSFGSSFDECDKEAQAIYDKLCKGGEEIVDEVSDLSEDVASRLAQITWDETLAFIQTNSTVNATTGALSVSQSKVNSYKADKRWGQSFQRIIDNHLREAEKTFDKEFRQCADDWEFRGNLHCAKSSAATLYSTTNPLVSGFSFYALYKMMR